ncbi:hypothetical protein ADUPG1_014078 [Aduncisulcus paluster]|uniref:Uncharacterized protein n=1 Tax=Aduncisulcus paluster TaxID=2918883 RepID=A0ABQ5KEI1_9EUKA|nr:hypothetical protein ADUPG1_014078 [Aduncisulcus paluster]|eukprot:gnl/Carplike_NY0171/3729_a5036_295.p1 GENE.gnl/Carplike_NY0171/3729_a5036_295~~gnl/Carplike_NY0171/3729_a5036_295.p1  ORF type:complete len:349 (+),score=46.40 gnl/Carplike_NY0171/3729_a5036_295:66-1112(+)
MESGERSSMRNSKLSPGMMSVPSPKDMKSPSCIYPDDSNGGIAKHSPAKHVEFVTPAVMPTPRTPSKMQKSHDTTPSSPSNNPISSPSSYSLSDDKRDHIFRNQRTNLHTIPAKSMPIATGIAGHGTGITGITGGIMGGTGFHLSARAIPDLDKVVEEKVAVGLIKSSRSMSQQYSLEARLKFLEALITRKGIDSYISESSICGIDTEKPGVPVDSQDDKYPPAPSIYPPATLLSSKSALSMTAPLDVSTIGSTYSASSSSLSSDGESRFKIIHPNSSTSYLSHTSESSRKSRGERGDLLNYELIKDLRSDMAAMRQRVRSLEDTVHKQENIIYRICRKMEIDLGDDL